MRAYFVTTKFWHRAGNLPVRCAGWRGGPIGMTRFDVAPPQVDIVSPLDPVSSYEMTIDTPASDVWDFGKATDLGFLPAEARR